MSTSIDTRHLSPAAQEALRQRVVHAVCEQRMSKAAAARTFCVSRTSVHHWVTIFQRRGPSGLKSKPRGRPPRSRLKGHQAATTVRLISDRCPDQRKMPFALWTREAVQQLIAAWCGVALSPSTVGRYLRRWEFTPQKPLRYA